MIIPLSYTFLICKRVFDVAHCPTLQKTKPVFFISSTKIKHHYNLITHHRSYLEFIVVWFVHQNNELTINPTINMSSSFRFNPITSPEFTFGETQRGGNNSITASSSAIPSFASPPLNQTKTSLFGTSNTTPASTSLSSTQQQQRQRKNKGKQGKNNRKQQT